MLKLIMLYICTVCNYLYSLYFLDSRLLPQNHRQQVFPNGTLIIREVNKKADEGKYTCMAENKEGDRAHKDVYVQVMGKLFNI